MEQPEVLGLAPIVQLSGERATERIGGLFQAVAGAELGVAVEEGRQLPQSLQIFRDPLADSGRWTFTATGRPSRKRARWTCPREAAASGTGSNSANAFPMRTPSSVRTISSTSAKGNGSTSS